MKASSTEHNTNPQLIMKIRSIHSASQTSSTGYDACALIHMSWNDYSQFAKVQNKYVYNSNVKQHSVLYQHSTNSKRKIIQVLNRK
jgi:hypothetical protein